MSQKGPTYAKPNLNKHLATSKSIVFFVSVRLTCVFPHVKPQVLLQLVSLVAVAADIPDDQNG